MVLQKLLGLSKAEIESLAAQGAVELATAEIPAKS
jgi:hypothetical protein